MIISICKVSLSCFGLLLEDDRLNCFLSCFLIQRCHEPGQRKEAGYSWGSRGLCGCTSHGGGDVQGRRQAGAPRPYSALWPRVVILRSQYAPRAFLQVNSLWSRLWQLSMGWTGRGRGRSVCQLFPTWDGAGFPTRQDTSGASGSLG